MDSTKKEYQKPEISTEKVELGVFGCYGGRGGRRGGRGGRGGHGGHGGRRGGFWSLLDFPLGD